MKAIELLRTRIVFSQSAFAELVLWKVPNSVRGSVHEFKYRLAYVVDGLCVVRYDNEAGKGDHRHFGEKESTYTFQTPEQLIADFERDIARWNRENRNS
ncbi:MAG: toxin-antitoxin system TumE family protein [Lysobacterales bacterium]